MTEAGLNVGGAGDLPVLRLRRGEDRRLRAGHLWVFSNEIDVAATPLASLPSGSLVRLESERQQFLGYAYANPHALICARILSRVETQRPNEALLEQRLRSALALRERLYADRCYRWVYGESDALPGLVLDRFDDVVVGQIATAGMEALRPLIEAAVMRVLKPRVLLWKNDGNAREMEGLVREVRLAHGSMPKALSVVEGGLQFSVPMDAAQKTGWFYDQVANRALWRRWLPAEARVLDICGYAGAWSLLAMAGGARAALCVDSSEAALTMAHANAAANKLDLQVQRGDAFDVLAELDARGERFDAVVVDPPAFIKRRRDQAKGTAAYRKLNRLAMRVLAPEALLVSCSCSYHLGDGELVGLIQSAARAEGQFVQVLHRGGQGPDHPLHPAIAESAYLKAFFCRLTRE